MIANGSRFINLSTYAIVVRSSFQISNHITLKYDVPGSREQYAKLGFAETDEERESMSNIPYLQIVGSILYACVMTRPDCMFYISNLCRYLSNPSRACFKAAQQLLMYLGKTRDLKITFGDTQKLPSYFQLFAESLRKTAVIC